SPVSFAQLHRSAKYQKALDGRKQPIRGLWMRDGQYVARVKLRDARTVRKQNKWVPLKTEPGKPITLLGEAKIALRKLMDERKTCERITFGAASATACASCLSTDLEFKECIMPERVQKFSFHDCRH